MHEDISKLKYYMVVKCTSWCCEYKQQCIGRYHTNISRRNHPKVMHNQVEKHLIHLSPKSTVYCMVFRFGKLLHTGLDSLKAIIYRYQFFAPSSRPTQLEINTYGWWSLKRIKKLHKSSLIFTRLTGCQHLKKSHLSAELNHSLFIRTKHDMLGGSKSWAGGFDFVTTTRTTTEAVKICSP